MPTPDTADYKALFITTARDHVNAIDAMLEQHANNTDGVIVQELFRHVHSLKGSSAVMGYKNISHVCEEIDNIIHPDGISFKLEQEKLSDITNLVKQLKDAIENI